MRSIKPSARHAKQGIAVLALAVVSGVGGRSASAQTTAFQVERYTAEDGLAQNRVEAVVQDRAGFIWIGTRRGLQRFDGRNFVAYAALDPAAPPELADRIRGLLIDPGGRLWIATEHELFRTDPVHRHLARIALNGFQGWAADSAGGLWVTDKGVLKRIDTNAAAIAALTVLTGLAPNGEQAVATSRTGEVWIAVADSTLRVVRFDPRTRARQSFRVDSLMSPTGLVEDAGGRLWLTTRYGVAVRAQGEDTFRQVDLLRGASITGFVPDGRDGFVAATGEMLVQIDRAGRITQRSISSEVVGIVILPARVMVDREGGFWFASLASGLTRLTDAPPVFKYFSSTAEPPFPLTSDFITAVFERADGTLWAGTLRGGGAYRISPDWSSVSAFRHNPRDDASISADEIWDFEEDSRGNLWVATREGLCKSLGQSFQCFDSPGGTVSDIVRDDSGRFWLTLFFPNQIVSFDPVSNRFDTPVSIAPNGVTGPISLFFEQDSGYLWILGDGMARARVRGGRVVELPRSITVAGEKASRWTYQLHRDRHDSLWAGSDNGLLRWNAAEARFVAVDVPGLRTTTVFSIAEDRAGRMWLGTAHGLVQYSAATGGARRYTKKDGFFSGELNRRAVVVRRNGQLVFGGIQGLTQFDPDVVTGVRGAAPIVLTRWRKVSSRGTAEAAIDGVDELRLEPHDRAFTVEFAALTFAPTIGRRFRYQLAGPNADWIESAEPVATFPKPRPGRYVFRAQTALGAEGAWSNPGAAVAVVVIPPFWGTTWFRALLVLLVAALVWSAHKLRLRQAIAAEQLRVRISRDLHDDIGAGLSSIALISDSVDADQPVADQLRKIGEAARSMVADLRDIVWAIDPDRDRLEDMVSRMQDIAAGLLPNVQLTFDMPPAGELASRIGMTARRDLLLLYKEMLHNIAKHAHATEVHIQLIASSGDLELRITDNGNGFSYGGNGGGTGLKSVRERAARLGGLLELHSQPGGGTAVQLTLNRT